jgi:hypothetical protein
VRPCTEISLFKVSPAKIRDKTKAAKKKNTGSNGRPQSALPKKGDVELPSTVAKPEKSNLEKSAKNDDSLGIVENDGNGDGNAIGLAVGPEL